MRTAIDFLKMAWKKVVVFVTKTLAVKIPLGKFSLSAYYILHLYREKSYG